MLGAYPFEYWAGSSYPLGDTPQTPLDDREWTRMYNNPFKKVDALPEEWLEPTGFGADPNFQFSGLGDGSLVSTSTDILTMIEKNWIWVLGALALIYFLRSSQQKK